MWNNNAKGIFVEDKDGDFDPNILDGKDFLIAKTGEQFGNSVQKAFDKNKILLLFKENLMGKHDVNYGWNNLPSPNVYWQFKELDQMIYIGDPANKLKRAIHGIILDCSKLDNDEDGFMNPSWIVYQSEYMLKNIWERYQIPVYLYMNTTSINYWKEKDPEGVEGIYAFIKRHGVSTVSICQSENDIPVDGTRPILPYDDSSIRWDFWLYSLCQSKLYLFLYNGDRKKMAEDFNYQYLDEPEIPPDDEDEPEIPPIITEDEYTKLNGRLDQIETLINKISIDTEKTAKHFSD